MRWIGLAMTVSAMSVLAMAAVEARAADPIVATQDRATIIKLSKDASNIIIGNPSYFEVTLEDPRTLILFGKTPGQTNMIIWDAQRRDILNTTVVILPDRSDTTLRVYSVARGASGAMETTYACANGACVRASEGAAGPALAQPAAPPEGGGGAGPASPPPGGGGSEGGGGGGGGGNSE